MTKYGSFPGTRPRRLRTTPVMRRMVAETRLHPADFILPAFVREGVSEPVPIGSMPGVVQHTRDSLKKAAVEAVEAGVSGIMLFGVPEDEKKDAVGTPGTDPDGILQVALRDVRAEVGDELLVMSDLCLDETTDHGHCGVLDDQGRVDNDATLPTPSSTPPPSTARSGRPSARPCGATARRTSRTRPTSVTP
jgi:porphobilinogen synthase